MSELGWRISGCCRAVRAAAMQRARLRELPNRDPYRKSFVRSRRCAKSWATQSLAITERCGVQDWPNWQNCITTLREHKRHFATSLCKTGQSPWAEGASCHRAQVPYICFQAVRASHLAEIRKMGIAWSDALCIRSWSRLRACLIVLRNINVLVG